MEPLLSTMQRHSGKLNFSRFCFNTVLTPILEQVPIKIGVSSKGDQISGIKAIDLLLSEGADIDAQAFAKDPTRSLFSGRTVVMVAVARIQYEVALHLLRRGADFRIEDDSGDTLLDILRRQKDRLPDHNEDKGLESVIDWLREASLCRNDFLLR